MKRKIFSIFLLLALAIGIVGCNKETTAAPTPTTVALDKMTTLSISKGIVYFDEVSGASEYVLRIKQDGVVIDNVIITDEYDLNVSLADGTYSAAIRYTLNSKASPYSDEVEFKIGDYTVETMNKINGEDLKNESYINFNGRTYYLSTDPSEAKNNAMYFYYTASGFRLNFHGTELKATIYATGSSSSTTCAYVVVLVDGDVYPEGGTTIALNKGEVAEYTLCTGLTEGDHTVEFLKRTEASDNLTAIKEVSTDGNFLEAPKDRDTNILVLGASGSAGYGNLATSTNVTKNPYNSDGLKAFPYLISRMYDADITEVNASGWGVKWGWNSQSGTVNIPTALEKVGINNNNTIVNVDYDCLQDKYDIILINLGMNDFNAYLKGLDTNTKTLKIVEYNEAIKLLYIRLHSLFQDAKIFMIATSMTDLNAEGYYNNAAISEAMKEFPDASGFIFPVTIPANGSNNNSYGANSHANVGTHIESADAIAEEIEKQMEITKIRENITFVSSRDTVK